MSRDLRKYARSTTARLILGALVLLFVLGDGLIALLYGRQAAILALLCTGAGLLPLALIAGWLWLMGRIARKLDDG
jgi:O-antigen/teichoic acid export membrane protein